MSSPHSLDFYDDELRDHHEHLRAAYGISPGDEVVDIGCGTGLTTREAARAAAPGRVVGVEVSERMLERARQVTSAERLDIERLREMLAAHYSDERGVILDSRSWLITARRRR